MFLNHKSKQIGAVDYIGQILPKPDIDFCCGTTIAGVCGEVNSTYWRYGEAFWGYTECYKSEACNPTGRNHFTSKEECERKCVRKTGHGYCPPRDVCRYRNTFLNFNRERERARERERFITQG